MKYLKYIKKFKVLFRSSKGRRKCKMFKKMSEFIGTRTPDQCRSHHQRFKNRFETLDRIIEHLQKQELIQKEQESLLEEKFIKSEIIFNNEDNEQNKDYLKTSVHVFQNSFRPTEKGISFTISSQVMFSW